MSIFRCQIYLASSNCFSLAFLFAFLPCVFANLALASDNISNSANNTIVNFVIKNKSPFH